MKRFSFTSIFLVVMSAAWTYGQLQSDSIQHLKPIEVFASQNKTFSELGRVVSIVTQNEIKNMPIRSLDELLDNVASIDIRQRGIHGTQSDISIRGGSFDQVLILLNGVNITNPQTGHYNLDIPLELADIERVEILQGSSARVLGANAFSGAINIVTEKSAKSALKASLEGGSFGYLGQSFAGSLVNEKLKTFASFSHKSSDGHIANTDFEILNAFSQTTLQTNEYGKFDLQLAAQEKAYGANSFYSLAYPNQYDNTKNLLTSLQWNMTKNNVSYNAQAYWRRTHDRFELFRDNLGAAAWYKSHNYHMTDVTGGKVSLSYLSAFGKSTMGIDLRNEHIYSNVLGTNIDSMKAPLESNGYFTKASNRFIKTGYIDHALNFGKWYLSAGASVVQTTAFGLNPNLGVDLAYNFNHHARVFIAANTAVRIPTFTDLYYKSATQISNPNLLPEKSTTVEIGTKIEENDWMFDATVYYRMASNVIDWVKAPDSLKWESKNITEVNALGGDFSLSHRFRNSFVKSMSISYSYLQLDKEASGFDSKYALDYMRNRLMLASDYQLTKKLTVRWKASYMERAGNYTPKNSTTLQSFDPQFILDARVIWTEKYFDIYVDANNVFNTSYVDYGGLLQPGINFNAGVRVKI